MFVISDETQEPPAFTGTEIRKMDKMMFDELAGPHYLELKIPKIDFDVLRDMIQEDLNSFDEIHDKLRFIHHMPESYPITLYRKSGLSPCGCSKVLEFLARGIPDASWEPACIDTRLSELIEGQDRFSREAVLTVAMIGICGKARPIGTFGQIAYLLGRKETVRRLLVGIAKLG